MFVECDGEQLHLRRVEQTATKPAPSLVRELLGKYSTDEQNEDLKNDSIKTLRKNLYGKIND